MPSRRSFLRTSAALLPAFALASRRAWALSSFPIGLQLYTLRKLAERDLPDVLEQVHRIGYTEVETYDAVYSYAADALRHMLADAGLAAPSGHFAYEKFDTYFDYARSLGMSWMVISAIPSALWGSADGFATAAKQFNVWGQKAKDMGMRFAFHNHDYEFRPLPNHKTGYDVLVEQTDPSLVFFEVDCYWAAQAGLDPVALIRGVGHRVKMLHLKDRKPGFPPSFEMNQDSAHFVPVGKGSLDWKAILAEAQTVGVEHYFVEQDQTTGSPYDAIKASYQYLHRLT